MGRNLNNVPKGMSGVRYLRKARVLALARGFRGMAKTSYRIGIRRVHRALMKATYGRRTKKRMMRRQWIMRIHAGTLQHGLPYRNFIYGLRLARIQLDRRVLSHLTMHEPFTFQGIVKLVSKQFRFISRQWRRYY